MSPKAEAHPAAVALLFVGSLSAGFPIALVLRHAMARVYVPALPSAGPERHAVGSSRTLALEPSIVVICPVSLRSHSQRSKAASWSASHCSAIVHIWPGSLMLPPLN